MTFKGYTCHYDSNSKNEGLDSLSLFNTNLWDYYNGLCRSFATFEKGGNHTKVDPIIDLIFNNSDNNNLYQDGWFRLNSSHKGGVFQ